MATKGKHKSGKLRTTPKLASVSVQKTFAARTASLGWFERFARSTAHLAGRPVTFFAAVSIVVIWAVTGPIFHFSDTWQLVINTGTTIVTFLMVFLIQQSQNRDTMAVQIKTGRADYRGRSRAQRARHRGGSLRAGAYLAAPDVLQEGRGHIAASRSQAGQGGGQPSNPS